MHGGAVASYRVRGYMGGLITSALKKITPTENRILRAIAAATLLPAAAFAQDEPLPALPGPSAAGGRVEDLGESLFLYDPAQPLRQDPGTNAGELVAEAEASRRIRKVRWQIEPHLLIRGVYNDNIFIAPVNEVSDYVFTFSPGLAIGLWDSQATRDLFLDYRRGLAPADRSAGSFIAFDYTGTGLVFAETDSLNTWNHDARFDARWDRPGFGIGSSFRYETRLETNADPGRLVTRETIYGSVTGRYNLTSKLTLDAGLFLQDNRPSGFVRTTEWRGEWGLNYIVSPRLRIGLLGAAGKLDVSPGFDQTYNRFLLRSSYTLDEKFDVEFRGGIESRISEVPGDRDYAVFDLRARWTPAAGTRLILHGYRNVNKSIFQPTLDFTATGVTLAVEQAVWNSLVFTVTGGYEVSSYYSDPRRDEYFFIRPGLYYPLGTWGTIGISYEYRENQSNRFDNTFANNQVTLDIAVKF